MFGRRIRKTDEETGQSTLFFWQDDRMVTECDEAHADFTPGLMFNRHTKATDYDCTSYLYEPGGSFRPLAQLKGRGVGITVCYYVNDQIGTPQELLDEDGNVVWSAIYRAYGHAEMQAGVRQPLRFQGQYADEESGLHYNRYRYYNPLAGRYISQDPIGLAGGVNSYAYTPNPLKYIDPLGLCKVENARARQAQMLQDDVGYNISPKSWDQYPAIGRDGTFVTDKEGALKYFNGIENGEVTISKSLASTIEKDMGLYPGSLIDGFNIRKVEGISNMQPRSPLSGNDYFLGPGQHLPSGAPEMVINSVPTSTPVTIRVNVN